MVKSTPKPLKDRRKSSELTVMTPTCDEPVAVEAFNFESSYLSICCLVQSESQASLKLVNESNILPRMLERLLTGAPRDIEELTLGAIHGSLSWVSAEVVQSLVELNLVDYCHSVITRHVASRVPDRSCETAVDIIRDLVNLNDHVEKWMLDNLEFFVRMAISCPTDFPAVTVKRSVARLVQTMVELHPRAFVSGLAESRLPTDLLQGLFALCNCPDLETSCYMVISALTLEQVFGSDVIPASRSIALDPLVSISQMVEEATTFTTEPTNEDQLRLDRWRSKLRGLGSLVDYIRDIVEGSVSEAIEKTDSIEERRFYRTRNAPYIPLVDKLIPFDQLLTIVEKLALSCKQDDESSGHQDSTILEDRDLTNVFGTVADLFKIRKVYALRFSDRADRSVGVIAAKTLEALAVTANIDLAIGGALVQECVDVLQTLFLSLLAGKTSDRSLLDHMEPFMKGILERVLTESITLIDNKHIVSQDEDEEISALTISCLQVIQTVYLLGSGRRECGTVTLKALGSLADAHITPSIACWIAETLFVVFGDVDNDDQLNSYTEWVSRVSGLAVFLNAQPTRSSFVQGTIENLKAFVKYKRC